MPYKHCVLSFTSVKTWQQVLFAFENDFLYFWFHHSEPSVQAGTSN